MRKSFALLLFVTAFAVFTNTATANTGFGAGAGHGHGIGFGHGHATGSGAGQGFNIGAGRGYTTGAGQGFNTGAGRGYTTGAGQGFNTDAVRGYNTGAGLATGTSTGYGYNIGTGTGTGISQQPKKTQVGETVPVSVQHSANVAIPIHFTSQDYTGPYDPSDPKGIAAANRRQMKIDGKKTADVVKSYIPPGIGQLAKKEVIHLALNEGKRFAVRHPKETTELLGIVTRMKGLVNDANHKIKVAEEKEEKERKKQEKH